LDGRSHRITPSGTHSHGKIIVVNKCSAKELASPQSEPRSLEVSQKCWYRTILASSEISELAPRPQD
jgi:hypothetical protein